MISGLSRPLDHNEPFKMEFSNETAEVEIYLQLSMQEKLARAIDKKMNSKISSISRTTKDVMGIVKKKIAFFEVDGKRGANIESCYENFNSIPPSSVEPERVFLDVEELLPKKKRSHVNLFKRIFQDRK
jgi:hypothetical protein